MADSVESVIEEKVTKINKTTSAKKNEPNYPLDHLIDSCEALGYKREIVAGAFFNTQSTEMTKVEFITTIKNFLGKKAE